MTVERRFFWLSSNEKGQVIGEGDTEVIQFLVDDHRMAAHVHYALNKHERENERKRMAKGERG